MNENLTFVEKCKLKIENGKTWISAKISSAIMWIEDHPTEAIAIGGAIATGTSKAIKVAKLHSDRVHRERDFYDPRLGRYTRARRKPTNDELDYIERRYKNGDSYNSIFRDMGLRR